MPCTKPPFFVVSTLAGLAAVFVVTNAPINRPMHVPASDSTLSSRGMRLPDHNNTHGSHHMCISTAGYSSHISIIHDVIAEALNAGNQVTLFFPHHFSATVTRELGGKISSATNMHFLTWASAVTEIPDELLSLIWGTPHSFDALLHVILMSLSLTQMNYRPEATALVAAAGCDVFAFSPFHAFFGDEAARLGIPAAGLYISMPAYTQPPFALVPIAMLPTFALVSDPNDWFIVAATAASLTPILEAFSYGLTGWYTYGYPRHAYSALYGEIIFLSLKCLHRTIVRYVLLTQHGPLFQ